MKLRQEIDAIHKAGVRELDGFQNRILAARLRSSSPEICIAGDTDSLTAEFRVEFWSGNRIVDVLEFFICRDGKLVSSEGKIRSWIQEDVSDVIERATT